MWKLQCITDLLQCNTRVDECDINMQISLKFHLVQHISSLLFFCFLQDAKDGSELPGLRRQLQIPREVIQRLRSVIFGFDFFVTDVENYQANGVLFKGNLRVEPTIAYDRIAARLKVCSLLQHFIARTATPRPYLCLESSRLVQHRYRHGNSIIKPSASLPCMHGDYRESWHGQYAIPARGPGESSTMPQV